MLNKEMLREIVKNPEMTLRIIFAALVTAVIGNLAHLAAKLLAWEIFFYLMNSWAKSLCFILGINYTVYGSEIRNPSRPSVIISNHQTLLDIFVDAAVLHGRIVWIAKGEIKKYPVVGRAIRAAGFMFTSRSSNPVEAKNISKRAIAHLKQGRSVFIFVEGHRNYGGPMREFQLGAFRIAREANVPIIFTHIDTAELWPKKSTFPHRGKAIIRFGDRIISPEEIPTDKQALKEFASKMRQLIIKLGEK